MRIAFFGHSQFKKTDFFERKILEVLKEKVGDGKVEMLFGGYGYFDDFAYDCAKKLKETNQKVALIYVTPYLTVNYQSDQLKHIEKSYDGIVYPDIEDKPMKFAISYRNRWMVDKADFIIFGIDHDWGGAYNTYIYAKRKKKTIYNVTGIEF